MWEASAFQRKQAGPQSTIRLHATLSYRLTSTLPKHTRGHQPYSALTGSRTLDDISPKAVLLGLFLQLPSPCFLCNPLSTLTR